MTDTPPLQLRQPGCSRRDCRGRVVVHLSAGGVCVRYCLGHADGHAAAPGVEVAWLADGLIVCPLCARIVHVERVSGHYNSAGLWCPPWDRLAHDLALRP